MQNEIFKKQNLKIKLNNQKREREKNTTMSSTEHKQMFLISANERKAIEKRIQAEWFTKSCTKTYNIATAVLL